MCRLVLSPHPPPSAYIFSIVSVPSVASGAEVVASNATNNAGVARKQAQEMKYPLWKYIKRQEGPQARIAGGRNVLWTGSFCNTAYKST